MADEPGGEERRARLSIVIPKPVAAKVWPVVAQEALTASEFTLKEYEIFKESRFLPGSGKKLSHKFTKRVANRVRNGLTNLGVLDIERFMLSGLDRKDMLDEDFTLLVLRDVHRRYWKNLFGDRLYPEIVLELLYLAQVLDIGLPVKSVTEFIADYRVEHLQSRWLVRSGYWSSTARAAAMEIKAENWSGAWMELSDKERIRKELVPLVREEQVVHG